MAVIQTIREKYAKVAGFIIALALVGFILMDAASGKIGDLFGRDTSVAKVDGKAITMDDYNLRVRDFQNLFTVFQPGTPDAQVREAALNDIVTERLVITQAKKLGLVVTDQEVKDATIGNEPDDIVKQFVAKVTGKEFDPAMVAQLEQLAKKGPVANEDPGTAKVREAWVAIKDFTRRSHLVQKYMSLVTGSVYQPAFVSARADADAQNLASMDFVKIPLSSINDNDVTVTDAELNDYMKKHPAQFNTTEASRSIRYVVFEVKPDAGDTTRSLGELTNVREDFATNADYEGVMNRSASETRYTDQFLTKNMLMSAYADSILAQPAGAVYGPYFENGSYKLSKVVAKTTLPDSVKSRHILVKTDNQGQPVLDSMAAKARIDSAIAAINAGMDWKAAVEKYSDDDGSKTTAGEYTFSLQDRPGISKEFGDFVFEGQPGQSKLVKVSNGAYGGYHYIQILEQKAPTTAAKVATITKSLAIGEAAEQAAFSAANNFAGKNTNGDAFTKTVKAEGLNTMTASVKQNDFQVGGMPGARSIVHWVYEAKPGEVSSPLKLDDRYLVVKMDGESKKGEMALNDANRTNVETMVRAEKKKVKIAEMYKGMNSLVAIAQKAGTAITPADSFTAANSFIPNVGFEPKVVGYAFNPKFALNTMSPPIKGNDGVFFINVKSRQQLAAPASPQQQAQTRMMAEMQLKNAMGGQLMEALKSRGEVKYNPKNIF